MRRIFIFTVLAMVLGACGSQRKMNIGGDDKYVDDKEYFCSSFYGVAKDPNAAKHIAKLNCCADLATKINGRVTAAVETYGPERIAVGIDAQGGRVKTAGWEQDAGIDFITLANSKYPKNQFFCRCGRGKADHFICMNVICQSFLKFFHTRACSNPSATKRLTNFLNLNF